LTRKPITNRHTVADERAANVGAHGGAAGRAPLRLVDLHPVRLVTPTVGERGVQVEQHPGEL
jgi:hypothetical protein